MVHRVRAPAVASALLISAMLLAVSAGADEIAEIATEVEDINGQAAALGPRYLKKDQYKGTQYVAERLIDGENFYRIKDYQRAAIIFMDIIENYSGSAAYTDALFMYADSLFLSRDYLGARVWFRKILDTQSTGIKRFRQKAFERLIEIAIHLGDYEGVEQYINQLGQMPTMEARYVKGKYLYFKGDLEAAKQILVGVTGEPLIHLKALYLVGVILTRQGQLKEAIETFQKGQEFNPSSKDEREIVDLMNLGAGRLYYEQGFVEHASECYQKIPQNSPHFDAKLYESATVLVRAGDTIRAEQTLEFLTVAMPDSKYIPKAKMLRGNLLLRTGRYDEAEKVFGEVVDDFTPVMSQLEETIRKQGDTRQFFFDLVQRSMDALNVSGALPPLIVKWVSEEREVQRAMNLATDLGAAREYVRETERLVRLLEAVIDGPSRINAIPMLREAKRRAQQISNQLGKLRGRLMKIAEKQLAGSAEVQRIGAERRKLESQLAALPTTNSEFEQREKKAREVYNRMRQELSRNIIRLDQLSAMVVAIERFISDPQYTEGVSTANLAGYRQELGRHQQAVAEMHQQISRVKNDLDSARYQVGVGDTHDRKDEQLKKRIRGLAKKERRILGSQGGKAGKRLERVHATIDSVERVVSRFEQEVDREADHQVESMRKQVLTERDRVSDYHAELRLLDTEAEEVIGGVTFENFSNVRKRFQKLIVKADVGIIDVAWLRKEEHTSRINELTKGRLNDIKNLDDEFQEVRGDKDNPER
ncbi:MAG: tetratricopeptide repeat protein [Deltaproteobacteria bacterium]|nr:tetratricopeptide repeat protein [Deltaproteobacteria bacterium]